MGIQGFSNNHYDAAMFKGIDKQVLKDLGVHEKMTKGISEQVFNKVQNLQSEGKMTEAHIAAARQILKGSHEAKVDSLVHQFFGKFSSSSEIRYDFRMVALDQIEEDLVIKELGISVPEKPTAYDIHNLADDLYYKFMDNETLPDDVKDKVYNSIMWEAINSGINADTDIAREDRFEEVHADFQKPLSDEILKSVRANIQFHKEGF